LGFAPPLVTTEKEVDQIIDLTHQAVQKVIKELTAEGALR
jgi:L-2,4-diaminobutyrate transaminase